MNARNHPMDNQPHPTFESEEARIDKMFWRHWIVLVSVPVLTTLVLAALLPAARSLLPEAWPWAGTDRLLAAGLYVMIMIFAWYVTIQQKRIMKLRDHLMAARFRDKEVRQRHRGRLMAFCALNQAIGDENDPREVFDTLVRLCQEIFSSDRVSLMLLNHRNEKLVVTAAVGIPDARNVVGVEQQMGEGIAGWVALHREPLLVGPDHNDPDVDRRRHNFGVRSAMVVPLVVRDRVAGVLSVANDKSPIRYDEDDLTTLQVFSETAEYCIRHAENADWMRGLIRQLNESRKESAAIMPVLSDRTVRAEDLEKELQREREKDDSGYMKVESRELEPLWAATSGAHLAVTGPNPGN